MSLVEAAFETQQAVAGAVEQLLQFGFPRSTIDFHADERFRPAPDAVSRDSGLLSVVSGFFAKLGGGDSRPLTLAYAEVLRRGGMLLSVETNTPIEEQTARTIFRNAGAVNLDASMQPSADARADGVIDSEPSNESQSGYADSRQVTIAGIPLYTCSPRMVALDLPRPTTSEDDHWGPRGDVATEADFAAFRAGTFEIRQTVERLSINKQARVVEELSVSKSVVVYHEAVKDTVRSTVVDVERSPGS